MNMNNGKVLNTFSFVVLVVYLLGTLYRNGIIYGVVLFAISLLIGGFTTNVITILVLTVVSDIAYKYINYTILQNGTKGGSERNTQYNGTPATSSTTRNYISVAGVYDPQIEGFEVIEGDQDDEEELGESSESSSKEVSQDPPKTDDVVENIKKSSESFKDNSVLFKLGELPSESKTGPFIDNASTLMKAMNSLDNNQMKSMTNETKNLLESQKSLMGMLENMRPILQDGRQLLDTFSGIFGGGSGSSKNMGDFSLGKH